MILIIYKIQRDMFIDVRENYPIRILHFSFELLISACFEMRFSNESFESLKIRIWH